MVGQLWGSGQGTRVPLQGAIVPQIAIPIGVLTSNKGVRAMNHFGGLDVALGCHCRVQWTWCHCSVLWLGRVTTNLRGAIAGCHCSVLVGKGRVTANFAGVDAVPLQGAVVARGG